MKRALAQVLLCGAFVLAARADSRAGADVTLWVVQPPGEVVAFDPADFSRVGGIRIPPFAFDHPTRLAINGSGQMLVTLDANHLWLWDGETARTLALTPEIEGPGSEEGWTLRQWLLGNDRGSLIVMLRVPGPPRARAADSVRTSIALLKTNFALEPQEMIAEMPELPCETHGEFDTWPYLCDGPRLLAPDGVVRDAFVLERWVQHGTYGDVPQADCSPSMFRRGEREWRASELNSYCGDPLLDVGVGGTAWVKRSVDDGSAISANEICDVTWLVQRDSFQTVFDEWSRFGNRNHDVSFFTAAARIAPGGTRVAYTIQATATTIGRIPVSEGGHPDTLGLASVRRSLAELPIVEVCEVVPGRVVLRTLAHCWLVGWISDDEIIVVEKRWLVAIDVRTGRRRTSGIEVRSVQDATVVWR